MGQIIETINQIIMTVQYIINIWLGAAAKADSIPVVVIPALDLCGLCICFYIALVI